MDPVGEVLARSAAVSISATLIALAIGIPLGTALALARLPGRRSLAAVVNTGMAVRPSWSVSSSPCCCGVAARSENST